MDHPTESWGHDPQLATALRDAAGDVPEIDFDALRGAVMARAELPLARMRRARSNPWRARFRDLVPLAAAAGVVGTALALGVNGPGPRDPQQFTEADRAQVEQILDASLPDVSEMVGQMSNEQLLSAASGS